MPEGVYLGSKLSGIQNLHPAYFASVMATGILALASDLISLSTLSQLLTWLNIGLYLTLSLLTAWRITCYPRDFVADLLHHGRCVGFFTTVAATNVLGNQFLVVLELPAFAFGLWCLGIVLWAVTTYGIFSILTIKSAKPGLETGINGGWLVAVVAAQSVSVLGTALSSASVEYAEPIRLFTLTMWLGGAMLYVYIIALIFYRYMFFTLDPSDLAPPYWINMGAMAISTLAGTSLVAVAPHSTLLKPLLPFLQGLTVLFWSTATWWIPILLILGFWRHLLRRLPITYDPLYWGLVFPLGMYAICTLRLARDVVMVDYLAPVFWTFYVAGMLAWIAAFYGMVRRTTGYSHKSSYSPKSSSIP
ncbi:MAG: tellurite resistance/C4-dicarboxylate transporter family protein [Planctomycetales bacterium]|nr:tellurite resistance/C4-dicarboxylate transporter family protein [Planctomycetales bacterium]